MVRCADPGCHSFPGGTILSPARSRVGTVESATTTRALGAWVDPETAFLALFAHSEHAFWLDSGADADTAFSYQGDGVNTLTACVADGTVTHTAFARRTASVPSDAQSTVQTTRGSVFDALAEAIAADAPVVDGGAGASSGEFTPGWVGWFGYEAGAAHSGSPHHASRYPDAAFLRPERMLVFDHARQTVTALVAGIPAGADADFSWLDGLETAAPSTPPLEPTAGAVARWRHSPREYGQLIRRAKENIHAGDAYLLCLTNEVTVDGAFDAVDVYRRLRRSSPSHHGGLVRISGVSLLSSSPEQFLRITADGTITTRPIKGTRPRGGDIRADAALRHDLLTSVKERAENLMIVDLMRNDLGRVAALGSVRVTDLLTVESYAQVHQLVSTVTARLAPGVTPVAATAAAFPAGSMTGAPKISAMTLLDEFEGGARGVYSGAFGYYGADGGVDLAMVIRSILIDGSGASIGTGGGITALSDPDEEIEETRLKAAALLDALGASQQEVG